MENSNRGSAHARRVGYIRIIGMSISPEFIPRHVSVIRRGFRFVPPCPPASMDHMSRLLPRAAFTHDADDGPVARAAGPFLLVATPFDAVARGV